MTFADKLRKFPAIGWVLVFSLVLVYPWLGSFGFWDPWELGLAERAREMLRAGSLTDPSVAARYGKEPPFDLFLAALGMKLFGVSELGGRFFNGTCALLALLGVYWAGAGLFRRRAGLLAALALGTMPLFFLQARQLTSDMPLVAGLTFALGGLGRFAWPAAGKRNLLDLLIAALGMTVATWSGGALLGVALPALTLLATVAVAWGLRPNDPVAGAPTLSAAGVGPDLPSSRTFGGSLLARPTGWLVLAIGLVGVIVLVATLVGANVAGQYSLLLGGVPRGGTPPQKFEYLIRQIGFGVFPWSAIVVFALGRALLRLGGDLGGAGDADADNASERAGRLGFASLYLLVFAAFGYALSTIFVLMTGEARFAPLAALALAVGVFLDEALEGERAEPVLGLLAGTGTMVVARDYFLAPEELGALHVLAKIKWPPQMRIGPLFLAIGLLVALGVYLALATRGRALGKVAPRDLGSAGRWRRRLESWVVTFGRYGIHLAVASAVVFALVVTHGIVPRLSRHYSFKPVLQSYTRYAKPDEAIGKYRVEGHGTGFYSERTMTELPTQESAVEFLRQPKRSFALVSADELAALDAALKEAKIAYSVVDASSSRFLLLSNQLGAGETDENPLKKFVWMAPNPPTQRPAGVPVPTEGATPGAWTWPEAKPPWAPPRVTAYAEFGNSIELIGADYPATLRRPGKIVLTLHFRVTQRPPAGHKIFVHFDAPGEPRLLGDHAPLDGAFPTSYWLPGEYIKDTVEVDVPLMTTPAGRYTLYLGFWPGGEQKRMPITGGINDGSDRARVGTIDLR
ncbi:MAG TPA: glycosyltransferase family 39 protein [Polyangia bacterium]